ncbi:MAG: protein kinase domain-containing protein, partial [Persicimonas sp.]
MIEGFTFREELAEGRMSKVVRAVEEKSGRTVALKILHEHLVDEEPIRRRLRRELAAVRRLDHPAIVQVEELIEEDDVVALVLEYVDGETVRERVERKGPLDWREAKPILDSVLAGLQEAHEAGIWHRDLNAEHILIDQEGRGRIVGFGMARVDELVGLTMHTRVLGALEAMAPERVLGLEYDGRADLYSVGAVAHEMLLGHPPTGGTMQAAFSHASTEQKVDEDLPDDLPPPARYILERSLVGDAAARFATASQMRRALDGVYDEKMWRTWTTRESTRCPECDAPVIVALGECVECGHDLRRLVRQPGRGEYYLEIISPHEAFIPDVWFEHNSEPDYLPNDEMVALMELLGAYQDTRPRANWATQYRDPPYLLFAELTREDVERVG